MVEQNTSFSHVISSKKSLSSLKYKCDIVYSVFLSLDPNLKAICKPRHWNLGIGIGIGTDITNVIISGSIRPMDPKFSRGVIKDERTSPTKSCDSSILWSRNK